MFQQNKSIGTTNAGNRFAEKDSLYLDLGRPELNGKIDTITSGSNNNSLLLHKNSSPDSPSPKSGSPFSKHSAQSSSFKVQATNNNQSFLKAAIFRNMQKNGEDEDRKEESPIKKSPEGGKHDRRHSDYITLKVSDFNKDQGYTQDNEETDDISQENPQIQRNVEKIRSGGQAKHPSKLTESPNKRMSFMTPTGLKKNERGY